MWHALRIMFSIFLCSFSHMEITNAGFSRAVPLGACQHFDWYPPSFPESGWGRGCCKAGLLVGCSYSNEGGFHSCKAATTSGGPGRLAAMQASGSIPLSGFLFYPLFCFSLPPGLSFVTFLLFLLGFFLQREEGSTVFDSTFSGNHLVPPVKAVLGLCSWPPLKIPKMSASSKRLGTWALMDNYHLGGHYCLYLFLTVRGKTRTVFLNYFVRKRDPLNIYRNSCEFEYPFLDGKMRRKKKSP